MERSHRTTARVRYGDTDQMGVVYHPNYVVYFEIGRTEFMRSYDVAYATMEANGLILAVVEMGARFRKPAVYDEVLTIETSLVKSTGVQVRFEYKILRTGNEGEEMLLCSGFTTLACINREGRPTRIPSPWIDRIEAAVAPGPI